MKLKTYGIASTIYIFNIERKKKKDYLFIYI